MTRTRMVVVLTLVLLAVTGCTSSDPSVAPLTPSAALRTATAMPVPPGAVLLERSAHFGPLEVRASSTAELLYALPLPPDAACPATLRAVMAAGYTVVRFEETAGPPVTDPDDACATDRRRSQQVQQVPDVATTVMIAFAPGVAASYADPQFSLVVGPPGPGDAPATRSRLRVTYR